MKTGIYTTTGSVKVIVLRFKVTQGNNPEYIQITAHGTEHIVAEHGPHR